MTEWPVWLVALGLTWSALILFGLLAFALFKLMDRLSRSSTAAPIAAESFTSEHPSAAHIQIDEPSLLYHFRHCVKAVLQLAQVSPESHDFALNTHPKKHLSSSASGSRRTLKKRASVRRLRPALPLRKPGSRQSLKDGTNPGPGINGTVKKSPLPPFLLDRSFSLAEHTHEWILSSLGRVKFTDHAPVLFQYIRSQLGYSMESLVASLESPLELWTTEGKSEALFFSSPDRRILFKTLRGAETGNLKAFLQDYASYMSTYPNSLLPKFLGLYTLERMSRGSDAGTWNSSSTSLLSLDSLLPPKFTVVAMAHVFDTPLPIHAKLDFKGSHLGREALDPQLPLQMQLPQTSSTPTSVHNPNPFAFDFSQITLKELDFHRLFNTGLINRLCLTPHVKSQLIAQLTRDITLLQKRGFMDYSLLVGIHRSRLKPTPVTQPTTRSNSPLSDSESKSLSLSTPSELVKSALQTVYHWTTGTTSKENAEHPGETEPLLVKETIVEIFTEESEVWVDEAEEEIPFHKAFLGGMMSSELPEGTPDDVAYEVYFVGIIDVLQKYNMVKWMERELKRQRTQLFRRESVSDKVREYPSPVSTLPSSPMEPAGTLPALPPLAPSTKHSQKRHSVQSHASTMSFISDLGPSGTSQYGEPSVEEPKRYGTRLLGFIQSVLA